jgi:hypothetical protein
MLLVIVKLGIKERKAGDKWKECQREKERTRTGKERKRKDMKNRRNKQFSGKNEEILTI